MRYGHHHARAADALAWLLAHPSGVEPAELEQFLAYRAALLGATWERGNRAIRGADVHREMFGTDLTRQNLTTLTRSAPATLSVVLEHYPRFGSHAIGLSDALVIEDSSPTTQAWREAARHAVLATETLVSAPGWTGEPHRAWQVIADVADTAEAIASLDKKLIPALPDTVVSERRAVLARNDELHMVARLVSGLACSGPLDASTDGVRRLESRDHPVQLRGLDDLVPATQTLAGLVDRHPFSIKELRHFALMQAENADACARLVTAPGLDSLRRSFQERDLRYRQLAGATTRTSSIIRPEGRPALVQLNEIRRMLEVHVPDVPMGAFADYDAAQPEVAQALTRGISRALNAGWYLVVDDRQVELAWCRSQPGVTQRLAQAADRLRGGSRRSEGARDLAFESGRLVARDLGADRRELYDGERCHGRHILEVTRVQVEQTESSAVHARDRLRTALNGQPLRRPSAPNRVWAASRGR